ncbi:response regulator transcription factor [Psychroserpens luteolus]|uniref:response regulator transcription factor n=1 Tax=Psychroserpens luteolus TaxID=2855840 RepID=UPI001E53085A|nr:LuxR C-terminal-related transcriptional regulator [Psychroserpens luteolus]MCD2260946.1 LuxR C-terminal-related transcriptional regulator [Psychroserpens luteolus]
MKRTIVIFGTISIVIILLFQVSKFSLMNTQGFSDVFLIISGILFIALGYFITKLFYARKHTNSIQEIDIKRIKELNISKQELKVLGLMSDGLSNNEIAETLFITENTVKSHVSKILSKLNAKRRTEAVKIGRDLNII